MHGNQALLFKIRLLIAVYMISAAVGFPNAKIDNKNKSSDFSFTPQLNGQRQKKLLSLHTMKPTEVLKSVPFTRDKRAKQ